MDKRIKRDTKMMKFIVGLLLISSIDAHAITFNEAVKALQAHESIKAVDFKSRALSEEAELKGSWGDPKFKIAAKNFPKDTLEKDQTPMTGIEFGISSAITFPPLSFFSVFKLIIVIGPLFTSAPSIAPGLSLIVSRLTKKTAEPISSDAP